MKIVQTETATVASTGDSFTIAANSKAFKILSDGLYADKIRAIIRELACNARDSHVAAGVTQPFLVHLPHFNDDNSAGYFAITDFGTGLSHDDVLNIYTKYFASTKTASNEFIGQLGLGSKSPFSYTREFTVISKHGGTKNEYRMFYDDFDIPRVELVGSSSCVGTGVTVKFAVRNDYSRWMEKAEIVFKWFDPKPQVIGQEIDCSTPEALWQGKGWQLFNKNHWGSREAAAMMGGVPYPIDSCSISGLTDEHDILLDLPILIDFEIGDLEVAASREGLSYDPRTAANIIKRLNEVQEDIVSLLQNEITAASNEYQAREVYHRRLVNVPFSYNIKKLFRSHHLMWHLIEIDSNQISVNTSSIYGTNDLNMVRSMLYGYKRMNRLNGHVYYSCNSTTKIFFNDLPIGAVGRLKQFVESNGHKHNILLFEPAAGITWQAMSQMLGGCPYRLVSELPPAKAVKKPQVAELFCFAPHRSGGWATVSNFTNWDDKETKYYIDLTRFDMHHDTLGMISSSMLNNVLRTLQWFGVTTSSVQVYGARKAAKKLISANSESWVNIIDYAIEKLKNNEQLEKLYIPLAASKVRNDISEVLDGTIMDILRNADADWCSTIFDKDSDMLKLISLYQKYNEVKDIDSNIGTTLSRLGIEVKFEHTDVGASSLAERVLNKYHMLKHVIYTKYTTDKVTYARYINTVDYAHAFVVLSTPD